MRAISIGIPFIRRRLGVPIDAQAQAHFNRVIADGGVVPSGLTGVNAFFSAVKAIYGTSDINTAISAAYDPHYLGYRLGAGSGTTLGQAARTLYAPKGIFGGIGTGSAYWEGTGVSGNFVSTPDAAANRITSDMEIVCHVNLPNYAPVGAEQQLVSKYGYSENNRCYSFGFLTSNNKLTFRASLDGTSATLSASATANCTLTANTNGYLKVTYDQNNGSGQYEVKFFQSTDGINYTQIGSTVTGASIGNTFTGAAPLLIGGIGSLATNAGVINGRILRTTISNSINGTPVVDFNPQQYTPSVSQTSWVSTTGETWTINTGTATTGYKGVLVDRTIVQGDGVDDGLAPTSNILPFVNGTTYRSWRIFETTRSNTSIVSLGNNPNEIDNKNTNNTINNVAMFVPSLNLRFAAMQRNESALQGIANVNNGATITNTISALGTNLNRIYLFQNIFSQNGNGIVNTAIVTPLLDNATTRTAMYNAIRGFNNNAF